jgi:ubiquinone/menaquinone biosynthesis C-methylase UbiE
MQKKECVSYGWYHVSMMILYGIIGFFGIILIIMGLMIQQISGMILLFVGLLLLIFFLWPAFGILLVNLYSYSGKTHPIINKDEIDKIKNVKILDIGCGSGRVSIKLAKELEMEDHVYGIDIFNNAIKGNSIEKVQKNAEVEGVKEKTTFQYGSATKIPFSDDTFDFITMSYVFHEINDKNEALKEIRRVLKPSGQFWLTEMHRNSIITILINGIYDLMFKSHKFYINLLEKKGFKLLEYRRRFAIGTFILKN